MTTLVVVPCGRAKLDHAAPAGQLYVGGQHRLARQAADVLAAQAGGHVVILSALHGLLQLDQLVEPYDVTMGDPEAVTVDVVQRQLAQLGASRVIALTPRAYSDLLRAPWVELDDRLAGSRGLLEQRSRLAAIKRSAPI